MAQPLIADMPRDITLSGAYLLRVTALDAATGATVSGVTVSNVVITAIDVNSGEIVTLDNTPNPLLVPTDETV